MSQFASIKEEEAALDGWPRRLLHVPSMTSFEWQPGHIYGSMRRPAYNAITYTWGRWRLEGQNLPIARAIKIDGVPWDIPRVDPSHFTVDDFQSAIHMAGRDTRFGLQVEFLWLDVACIDQRGNEPRSAAEVGRQGVIFKRAAFVFVWLTTFEHGELHGLLENLMRLHSDFGKAERQSESSGIVADEIYKVFRKLFTDPWFTSLWTLQEMILRRNSGVFLSRDGRVISLQADTRLAIPDLTWIYRTLKTPLQNLPAGQLTQRPPAGSALARCIDLADEVGLMAVLMYSPLMALGATKNRKTIRDEDRVYAIQQIFGFRLGNTSVDAPPGTFFTRGELEIELGQQLLSACPVKSQAHVFTKSRQLGSGWCVNAESVVPEAVIFEYEMEDTIYSPAAFTPGLTGDDFIECSLSVKSVGGHAWGHFNGKLCPLSVLVAQDNGVELRATSPSSHEEGLSDIVRVFVDASSQHPGAPESLLSGFWEHRGPRQRAIKGWLCRSFPSLQLQVLLLGRTHDREKKLYGLLLVFQRDDIWRRLGFCQFNLHGVLETTPDYDFFYGKTADWRKSGGYFG